MSRIKLKFLITSLIFCIFFNCDKNYYDISSKIQSEILDNEAYSKFITLNDSKIVYSDERTLSLKYYSKDNKKSFILDKIDNGPRIDQSIGKHSYFIVDNEEYIFYTDRINEKKKVFKLITKPISFENWEVFLNSINPIDFTAFLNDKKIFLVTFYDSIKFWVLKDKKLEEISLSWEVDFKDKVINNMSCFINNNTIFLYYILDKKLILDKFIFEKKDDNFYITFNEEIKIYDNIDCYDIAFYNNNDYYAVFYNNSKFELNIYNSKDKSIKKIGYFLNLFFIRILNINGNNYIFYSSIDLKRSKNNLSQYYISLIYNSGYKWQESIVSYFDFPVFGLDVSFNQDEFEVIIGSNRLILFKVKHNNLHL